jgi:acetolactate synthase I/II/III large subunit
MTDLITVGDLVAEFLAHIGVHNAYGVISIHNMPILDGFHTRGKIRFVSARGEAGACNMADADARVNASLGVVVTSTGTGAGNAAGALVEALTAGTPLLHVTGQIEAAYLDRDLGFIHEAKDQLAMLRAVGKDAFRISSPQEALAVLEKAVTLAFTAPCGPVSIEIAIDVQKMTLPRPTYPTLENLRPTPIQPDAAQMAALAMQLAQAKRPLLWLGGGARGAGDAVARLVQLGFGIVTSVQGRGIVDETHLQTMGAFNLQKAAQDLYAQCDAMLVVGSRLRSNETLSYKLQLPKKLWRIDANPTLLTQEHPYAFESVIQGDAALSLSQLADALESKMNIATDWHASIAAARSAAEAQVDSGLANYLTLKNELNAAIKTLPMPPFWVRDITLSNTMWGNRSLNLQYPYQGVHALGGGIGQGMQMAIGASIGGALQGASEQFQTKAIALCGDGGFMLNVGELACAVQERADVLLIVMNDACYGVIKNIQDADYGSRHAYVGLTTPNFSQLCASLNVPHYLLDKPAETRTTLTAALAQRGPVIVEVDMASWGDFAVKFAGPPRKV